MKVLIACEESQTVCKAFRKKGHESYSCDIQDCSGGHPEWHIKDNVINHLNNKWDLMIAHPECTYLSNVGIKHFNIEKYGQKALDRIKKREMAFVFFMLLINSPIKKICVENPVGYPNTYFRKPDQIIHPYYFGDPYQKRTCLWLKNLQPLKYDKEKAVKPEPLYICKGEKSKGRAINWVEGLKGYTKEERKKARSKTFNSIANAMAEQWG